VPVLPSVRDKFWKVDPKLGYAMKLVGGGVYVVTDDGWQSAFLVTDDGVVVFDAPETYGAKIPSAIASVTNQPIKYLIYSHIHRDHIGGAPAFRKIPGLKIVALQGVADFLKTQDDPERPVPPKHSLHEGRSSSAAKPLSSAVISIIQTKATSSSTYRKPSL